MRSAVEIERSEIVSEFENDVGESASREFLRRVGYVECLEGLAGLDVVVSYTTSGLKVDRSGLTASKI